MSFTRNKLASSLHGIGNCTNHILSVFFMHDLTAVTLEITHTLQVHGTAVLDTTNCFLYIPFLIMCDNTYRSLCIQRKGLRRQVKCVLTFRFSGKVPHHITCTRYYRWNCVCMTYS